MKKLIILLTLVLLYTGCRDPEEADPTGSIFVSVTNDFQIVEGAQITTEPATQTVTTDITGSALISDIPIGGYKINAFHPSIGSGSGPITVRENQVASATVQLIAGIFENPSIGIQSPQDNSTFSTDDEVSFSAFVNDNEDQPNTLGIEWSSDIDGILNTNAANTSGVTSFSTNTLSEGEHTITLKVTDSGNLESSIQISVTIKVLPKSVDLNPIELTNSTLNLSWSVSTEPEFSTYRVLRSENSEGPFDVIDVISDINNVTFTDTDVFFGTRYYYQIAVVVNNGDESFSNIESELFEGENIDVGVNIVRMKLDPVRPYIYAIDEINNSLLFINKESQTVEKTIFVGSSPSDIAINLDNSKAYISNYGSTQISVIDLESREKTNDIFVNTQVGGWDGNPYRLTCLSNNRLAYTSEDQWNSVKMINADNGNFIADAGSVYQPGLISNSTGTILFVTESGSSGSATIRFNVTNTGLSQVDESNGGSSYGSRDGCISGDDTYIFHRRRKYLANNLNSELGTFTENIIDCSHDGSIAVGMENIWNSETFSIIKPLPISSSIVRLDNDGNTIYIYDNNTSKIYITTIN